MATKQSPRNENGIIKWYEGDAFFLDFSINDYYTKQPIELGENDKIVITFHRDGRIIKIFNNASKTNEGLFRIHIDQKTTHLFKVGIYHYDIEYHKNDGETIQTIYECGEAEVEGCCKCQA